MVGFNQFSCVGNLCSNVDVRNIGELVVASGSIAIGYKKGDDEDTTFVNFECFGKRAETLGLYTKKGSRVLMQGKIFNNNYKKKDGGEVYGFKMVVDNFLLLDNKKDENKEKEG